MKVNPSIFKSYDIRGTYPTELNEEIAYRIGQGFVYYLKTKRVVVGQDGRLSSPTLYEALVKGIIDQGADVYNLGQAPTECLYFSIGHFGYESGIMITASHNPKEYNGFKMIMKKGNNIELIRGKDMFEIVTKNTLNIVDRKGEIKNIDIWQDYLNHIFSFADISKIKPLKVVLDAGNGMAGKVLSQILPELPIKAIPLNFDVDGNFPNRPPNPLLEDASEQIGQKIKEEKADLGFMFDGDADRIFLIDENGNFTRGDIVLLILAKYFLERNPGSAISYNLICSKAVPEFIKKWRGNPIRTQVGFANVREGIIKNNGIMGGEVSGHYCFRDNFYLDSGFIAFLTLLQLISESNKKVSEITTELSPYTKAPEINLEIENKEGVINKVKEKYSNGKQDYLDGVTVEYEDWWFNIRPSQTEPLLRLTIEAKNQEMLEEKKKELMTLIKEGG